MCQYHRNLYIIITIVLLALIILASWWRISYMATPDFIEKKLSKVDQDPTSYLSAATSPLAVSSEEQARLTQTFLKLYFQPWEQPNSSVDSSAKVLKAVLQDIDYFSQNIGWQLTYHSFSPEAIKAITDNIDLSGYPRIDRPAIVTHISQVRVFPTLLPNFNDPKLAGQGYPFDNWIASYIFPGFPVRVLQQSRDRLWYLIRTSSYYGWVSSLDVGFVSPEFISTWKNRPFVVPIRDGVTITNAKNVVISMMRKGIIYPRGGEPGPMYTPILAPIRTADGDAQIQTLLVNNADIQAFPIAATSENIAMLARSYIGGQYGWGDLYLLRDCSTTTSDILANFGMWLPRNSLEQGKMGKVVSLAGMNPKEKVKTISEQGIPFFSIVHFPGHIALYIGTKDGVPYILQDVWGIHTQNILGASGRGVIGKTVITPLDIGKGFSNVKATQIEGADSISVLTPDTYTDEEAVLQNVWGKP